MQKIIILISVSFFLLSCVSTPTKEKPVTFSQAKSNFSSAQGKPVKWLGRILKTTNQSNKTTLEVMALKSRYNQEHNELGRFLVEFSGFKDPAEFSAGKLIIVNGVLRKQTTKTIGQYKYLYPVIKATKHQFLRTTSSPQMHWRIGLSNHGVGLGLGF